MILLSFNRLIRFCLQIYLVLISIGLALFRCIDVWKILLIVLEGNFVDITHSSILGSHNDRARLLTLISRLGDDVTSLLRNANFGAIFKISSGNFSRFTIEILKQSNMIN